MNRRFRFIMGRNCIREVVKSAPERIVEVYTSQHSKEDLLYAELLKKHIAVREVSKKELFDLVQSESHQSYIAAVKERGHPDLKHFFRETADKKTSVVLLLDSIYDPQNLGSIIRAGECFGADLVVYSKNRGADITPVVSKASAGGTEYVPIVKVSNLAETLKQFQKNGYWVVCAEAGEGSQSLYDFKFPEKTVMLLGSEGEGVQKILSKNSDFRLQIPMFGKIDSLNVSQASAVFLASYRNQHNS